MPRTLTNMRRFRSVLLALPLALAAVAAGTVELPYYALSPGPVREVAPLVRFEDHARYPSEGSILFTAVLVRDVTPVGLFLGWIDSDTTVVPSGDLVPAGTTFAEERDRAISQMDRSKLDAASSALRELTDYPRIHGDGVLVRDVVPGCAAEGALFPGDLIRTIDGRQVDTVREAADAIASVSSGGNLSFGITVDGEPEQVELTRRPCGGSEDALVGVSLIAAFPFPISISTGEVGGPSAGLPFALALFDLLSPGDLTQGARVAATGEIDPRGRVLPVGGILQKTVAAAEAGATVFLVPRENLREAESAGVSMQLVPIDDLEDALSFLQGSPLIG